MNEASHIEIQKDNPAAIKLQSIFDGLQKKASETLRTSGDMRSIARAQAELDLMDSITTQFFDEKRRINNGPTRLTTTRR